MHDAKRVKINGFALLPFIIIVAVLLSVGIGGGLYWKERQQQKFLEQVGIEKEKEVMALKEKKEDGASRRKLSSDECVAEGGEIVNTLEKPSYSQQLYIGEVVGMKCPCVCISKKLESGIVDTSTSSTSLTAGWKTYRNEKYGFEFKWPWKIVEKDETISLLDEKNLPYIDVVPSSEEFQTYCDKAGCKSYTVKAQNITIPVKFTSDAMAVGEMSLSDGSYLNFMVHHSSPEATTLSNSFFSSIKIFNMIDTSGWKTYRDEKYGFEVKYPSGWLISDHSDFAQFISPDGSDPRCSLYIGNHESAPINGSIVDEQTLLVSGKKLNLVTWKLNDQRPSYFVDIDAGELVPTMDNWEGSINFYTSKYSETEFKNCFSFFSRMLSTFSQIIDTSTWKTYRNEKYGFEVKYPSGWGAITRGGGAEVPAMGYESAFTLWNDSTLRADSKEMIGFSMLEFDNGVAPKLDEYVKSVPKKNEYGMVIRNFYKEMNINGVRTIWYTRGERALDIYFQSQNVIYWVSSTKDIDFSFTEEILSTFKFIESSNTKKTLSCSWHNDCIESAVCYNSNPAFLTPEGVVYGKKEGDQLCHRRCVSDQNCGAGGEGVCIEKEIFTGDVGGKEKFCSLPLR